MLKVLCVVDKEKTAIDRLSQGVSKYHENLDYQVIAVHPKRPDAAQLQAFEQAAIGADIIDWQYFRTAEMLRERYDWLASKKQILTHHNPYSITESDWNDYDAVVVNNETIHRRMAQITNAPLYYIPNTIDTDFWQFNTEWEPNKNVIMVANRIESKKGILPVAIACADAGLHFILVGSVSNPDYMNSIMATGNVEFHEQITDEKLKELYYRSTIHVCNSVDNFESGTLPILESMITGVPVLTREIGAVPDLYNGENLRLLKYDPDSPVQIAEEMQQMLFDKKALSEMREKAWQTAKLRNFERRAYLYQKLYRQVLFPEDQTVSVIMPICDKPEVIKQSLEAVAKQTYQNIELVVADDNWGSNEKLVAKFARYTNFPVRYINTSKIFLNRMPSVNENELTIDSQEDYGIARARNEALIEATGEIVVFCDQRIVMEPNAIEIFVDNLKKLHWLYGSKGAKKEFVENFSCAYRSDVIGVGMFNERINEYGGQSQEIRTRVRELGIIIEYVEAAKAHAVGKSSNRNRKRASIIRMKNRLAKMYEL